MRFVAIIGAGELGASIARTLATHGRVAEVRLIDNEWDVAAGKALDIQQAAPIESSPTRVTASSDLMAAVGAAAVLVADRVSGGPANTRTPADGFALRQASETASYEYSGDQGLALIRRLAEVDHQAVIVCAGCWQHPLLTQGLNELSLSRTRFFGSAPEAVVSALRAIFALEADVSPSVVALTVLGRVPDRLVVPWSDATIAGRPATRVLGAAQLARIERRAAAMPAPGPFTLAAAAARVADLIVSGSRKVVCCSVGLDGEFGLQRAVSAVPAVIGPEGIARLIAPSLDVREQVLLENVLASH